MADLSFTTSNQIIRDLYDTPNEAIQASRRLGCNGYRTYLINGSTKYVPCGTFVEYERALRYNKVQGKIGAFGSDTFGDKLVGFQFANSKSEINGDPFFTLGNFSIFKSVQAPDERVFDITNQINTIEPNRSYTLESIAERNLNFFEGKSISETVKQTIQNNLTVKLLFDRRKLDNYVLFSSLKERLKNTLLEISETFPSALNIKAVSITTPTVTDYNFFRSENRSTFKINLSNISNPFNIQYTQNGLTEDVDNTYKKYRNFSKFFTDYVLLYDGVEYNIVSATLPTTRNDNQIGLTISINGDPFSSLISDTSSVNANFYLKLKKDLEISYLDTISDLALFLLNKDRDGDYLSEFTISKLSETGDLVNTKEILSLPKFDLVNIDLFTDKFDKFVSRLNDIAESYDNLKTNLIDRFLTTDSLKEFDTEDRKFHFILQMYGKGFDDVKKYIDGITFMRNVSYDKINNIPDLLIKNYAHMLGLKTFDITDDEAIATTLFNTNNLETESNTTPAELNIELWRRILINTFYLFKSKGTRKSIDFILKLVGLPENVFEINEYVYLAERELNVANTLNKIYRTEVDLLNDPISLIESLPFDSDGYPTTPIGITFQENGGFLYENKNNIGLYDFGKEYIDGYRKIGSTYLFDLQRTIDNVKSWVFNTVETNRLYDRGNTYTNYTVNNDNLVINSKEVEIYLSSNRVFDLTIYRQYFRNIGVINSDLNVTQLNVSNLTFNQFVNDSLNNYVNPTNRKTIKTYPTLSKIYFDYLNTTNTPVSSTKSLEFLNKFDTSWIKLIEQFLPATSIVNSGKKIQNSFLLDNKVIYKHGLNNDINWLGTDGSEFQNKALRPVYLGTSDVLDSSGNINRSKVAKMDPFEINGVLGGKVSGIDSTINEYSGYYYGYTEYCLETEGKIYTWDSNARYYTSEFGGNILDNVGDRKGVFVIYDGELYRLNTKRMFTTYLSITESDYTTLSALLPPNQATVLGLKIWDKIPKSVYANTHTFKDSDISTITSEERSFYINSIGIGLAFGNINIAFDCPPPKPHVCYYDFSGSELDLSALSSNETLTYIDDTDRILQIKQPLHYGFSKNLNFTKPTNKQFGKPNNWAVPYVKRFKWEDGKIYYINEIIANINDNEILQDNPIYVVTGETFTASGTYPLTEITGLKQIATVSGGTVTATQFTGGIYESFNERVFSDPFMHIDPAYINKIILNPNDVNYTINLTKSLNLEHIFSEWSNNIAQEAHKSSDKIVNNQLFISDSVKINFEGFYPINNDSIGPFFTVNDNETFIHTLEERLALNPNRQTIVSIQSLNDSFIGQSDDVLFAINPGYYLVSKNSFLSFEFKLYFESVHNSLQTVIIRLVNSSGFVYEQQPFQFIGTDSTENRSYTFEYSGFFNANDSIYLSVEPIDLSCTLSRYETIEYTHDDTNEYTPTNDPRFRLFFNNGIQLPAYVGEGYSIRPIYNEGNLKTKNLLLTTSSLTTPTNNNIQTLSVIDNKITSDGDDLFNKIFDDYYKKHTESELNLDFLIFDKQINYDKIDFSFKVRSKVPPVNDELSLIPVNVGVQNIKPSNPGVVFEREVIVNNYFLGNTVPYIGDNDLTLSISLGKDIKSKINTFLKTFNYYQSNSIFNNEQIGTTDVLTQLNSTSILSGFNNLTDINYNNYINDINQKRRFFNISALNDADKFYYAKENEIFETEIYKNISDIVPLFDPYINNYELNDIVKVRIGDKKVVVSTPTGNTIESKEVFRLYVCINDINEKHLSYATGVTTGSTYYEIHSIYQPRGARSCFIEIEKYDTTKYNSWGYDDSRYYNIPNNNIKNYIGSEVKEYTESSEMVFNFNDVILAPSPYTTGQTDQFRYVYPKSIKYIPNKYYVKGEHIYHPTITGVTTYYRFFTAKKSGLLPEPVFGTNANWFMHTSILRDTLTPGVKFNVFTNQTITDEPSIGVANGVPELSFNWFTLLNTNELFGYSTTAIKLPKTINLTPINDPGNLPNTPLFNDSKFWGNFKFYIDTTFINYNEFETNNANRVLRSKNNYNVYTGVTMGLNTPDVLTDEYINGFDRAGKTNILLKPAIKNTSSAFYQLSLNETNGIYPLFERIGAMSERNNPKNFVTQNVINLGNFDPNNIFLGNKYIVNRGVLYKAKQLINSLTSALTNEPAKNLDKWVEKDFCLVNKFKYYKDRTSVKVFESKIDNFTDSVKDNLYFFNRDLTLKPGFTNRSFNGPTINSKLVRGLDFYYDVTDVNRSPITAIGEVKFDVVNSDIIMNYTPSRNIINFPLVGEFVGKLTISNVCGHTATTIFGILFDTDVNLLDRTSAVNISATLPNEEVAILPYISRVIVNQTGQANANLTLSKYDSISGMYLNTDVVVTRLNNYDKSFELTPNTDFIIKLSYDTTNNQTRFNNAKLNDIELFVNNNVVDLRNYRTEIMRQNNIETRIITLKNVSANSVILINLAGIESITSAGINNQLTLN